MLLGQALSLRVRRMREDVRVNPPSERSWAGRREIPAADGRRAARLGWDADADRYQAEHGAFLAGPGGTELVWSPEGWMESEVALLGDPTQLHDATVVDLGCGAGQAALWLAQHAHRVLGVDISHAQLLYGRRAHEHGQQQHGQAQQEYVQYGQPRNRVSFIQADAHELPLSDGCIDQVVSAFGVLAFVPDLSPIFNEVARVLKPAGLATISMPHPVRWMFPDDPAVDAGLCVTTSYFERTPYVEVDSSGTVTYAEYHHTMADIMNAIAASGLALRHLWEPDWRSAPDHVWGGWSSETVALAPRTLIVQLRKATDPPLGTASLPQ